MQGWGAAGGRVKQSKKEGLEEYTEVEVEAEALVISGGQYATVRTVGSFWRGAEHGWHRWVNQSYVDTF